MYLHHILRRPKKELIRKFYEAQKCKLSKGDWVQMVQENLIEINLEIDDEEISQLSKHKFKKLLKKKISIAAFDYLMKKKETHTKMHDTEYKKMEIQSYLKSDSGLTDELKQILVNLRTRMCSVRENFKNKYVDHLCQLCKSDKDDQPHLFMCQELINKCEDLANNTEVEYEDVLG